jgi:hypothetical protein
MSDHEIENGPQSVAAPRSPRLFILEFDLVPLSAHFFNQILGFRNAAEAKGMAPRVYLPAASEQVLAAALDGQCIIEPLAHTFDGDDALDDLIDAAHKLHRLWDAVTAAGVGREDLVLITSSRPAVILSLGFWLARLSANARPAAFIRFFDQGYLTPDGMDFGARARIYRLAARLLAAMPGQDRVFFTVNNEALAPRLERLCERRVFAMPVPKYYGPLEMLRDQRNAGGPVVYVHLNARAMLDDIIAMLRSIRRAHPRIRMLVKYCRNALQGPAPTSELDMLGAELIPADQEHLAYLQTIARSDIVLLPYKAIDYQSLASGVFCEAAAMGKVAIVPGRSWMASEINARRATGVLYDQPNATSVVAAVDMALGNVAALKAEARRLAAAFAAEHSCSRNLDLMRELADDPQDMRTTYALGSAIDFRNKLDSRCYLGTGWSPTEAGNGTWTDGPVAEIILRPRSANARPLVLRARVSPFLAPKHPALGVDVAVNGVHVAHWSFAITNPAHADATSREARIPPDIGSSGELRLKLAIDRPASPWMLGIGSDRRRLGLMFHAIELVIDDG